MYTSHQLKHAQKQTAFRGTCIAHRTALARGRAAQSSLRWSCSPRCCSGCAAGCARRRRAGKPPRSCAATAAAGAPAAGGNAPSQRRQNPGWRLASGGWALARRLRLHSARFGALRQLSVSLQHRGCMPHALCNDTGSPTAAFSLEKEESVYCALQSQRFILCANSQKQGPDFKGCTCCAGSRQLPGGRPAQPHLQRPLPGAAERPGVLGPPGGLLQARGGRCCCCRAGPCWQVPVGCLCLFRRLLRRFQGLCAQDSVSLNPSTYASCSAAPHRLHVSSSWNVQG